MIDRHVMLAAMTLLLFATPVRAEDRATSASSEAREANDQKAPSSLVILFGEGSAKLRQVDMSTLDRASRAYNEGKPIVMIITGSADRSGNATANLKLSQLRANVVLKGLLDRGIPAGRFQVLAKGETELPFPTAQGVALRENRRVVISWH